MHTIYRQLKQMDPEQQCIAYSIAGIRLVFNYNTGQEELEIKNLDRLKWLGIIS